MTKIKQRGLFSLQQALFIGFCATLLVAIKALLRMKLGLSGHSMLLMGFFYLICWSVVPVKGSVVMCGVVTGLIAMLLSVGKGGPLLIVKFATPALGMELALLLVGTRFGMMADYGIAGIFGSLIWATKTLISSLLIGLTMTVSITKFFISWLQAGIFVLLGAWMALVVTKRLIAHGLITDSSVSEQVEIK